MSDYSKIDWSELPELPDGLKCRLLVNELQVLKNGYVNAKRLDHDGSEWRYHCELQRHIETAFVATKIIDRFIAEQEAEQRKPKPRRVTPKELLVELIQTGEPVRIMQQTGGQPSWELKWDENGLRERCHGDYCPWGPASLEWLYNRSDFYILDTPIETAKTRLPVKTKAPEGCEWYDGGGGILFLRSKDGRVTMAPPTSRLTAECCVAVGNAYLELNP